MSFVHYRIEISEKALKQLRVLPGDASQHWAATENDAR
jgi:hypothetical protein